MAKKTGSGKIKVVVTDMETGEELSTHTMSRSTISSMPHPCCCCSPFACCCCCADAAKPAKPKK